MTPADEVINKLREKAERKLAAVEAAKRTYARILNDPDPQPGDAALLWSAVRRLGLDDLDVARDAAAVRALRVPLAELAEAIAAEREAGDAAFTAGEGWRQGMPLARVGIDLSPPAHVVELHADLQAARRVTVARRERVVNARRDNARAFYFVPLP